MEVKKLKFISFNCKLKSSFYAFLLPFFFIAIRYWHDEVFHLYDSTKNKDNLKILKYNLPYLFYFFLPKIFSLIFILIIKSNTKGDDSSNENKVIKNYHIAVEKRNKKKFILLIYIISLLESLHEDISSLLYYYEIYMPIDKNYIKGWLIEEKTCFIIFVPIFAYFILHTEIHRHHYLALLFGYFGSIFVNVSRFFLEFSYIEDYPFHLLNMLLSSIYSLSLVLIKYIMIEYILLSPYMFLLFDGIFNIINSILLILLQYIIVINLPDQNKKINILEENDNYFSNNFFQIIKMFIGQESEFYLYFFLSFIFSFLYFVIYAFVIYNNSIFLIILIEAFLPLDNDIIKIILGTKEEYIVNQKDKILKRLYYQSIGYIFLFFGALILNEMIIFNCCGLNNFTSIEMRERAKSDESDVYQIELTNIDDTSYVEEKED